MLSHWDIPYQQKRRRCPWVFPIHLSESDAAILPGFPDTFAGPFLSGCITQSPVIRGASLEDGVRIHPNSQIFAFSQFLENQRRYVETPEILKWGRRVPDSLLMVRL